MGYFEIYPNTIKGFYDLQDGDAQRRTGLKDFMIYKMGMHKGEHD